MSPQRIQRKRTKGWRMPDGAVYVGRPTKWGNPFRVETHPHLSAEQRVAGFRWMAELGPNAEVIRAELAGHDLACWCPLDQPCHADVLLEIANGGGSS